MTLLSPFIRRRTLATLAGGAILTAGLAAAAIAAIALIPLAPPPLAPPPATVRYFDRHGHALYEGLEGADGSNRAVSLSAVSPFLIQATIAAEDRTFSSNIGVEPLAVLRAVVQDLRAGRIETGASTITQQLARMIYFPPEERSAQTIGRKLREMALALRLARTLTKDQVMEAYLNRTFYGGLSYGAESAAQRVFGKPARDLGLAESALIAGLPQSPGAYDPLLHPSAALARMRVVLGLMERGGVITAAQRAAAAAEPLRFSPAAFPITAPHFVQHVRTLLDDLLGPARVLTGGLRVITTLDRGLQETAEGAVRRHLEALRDKQVGAAAVVALDPATGEILAMVGSADYFDQTRDGAVNLALALRQPGSAIKPVTYALALQHGFTAAGTIYDVPTGFTTRNGQSYRPNNYDATFHGAVTLRRALGSSLNLPAVAVLQAVGIDAMVDQARRMGLTTLNDPTRYDLSVTLGGGEVRLLDLTAAYAVFAAGGLYREPVAVLRVEDEAGHALYEQPPASPVRALPEGAAAIITDILADNAARAPAFGEASALRLDRPAAVKTGTTEDFRDNWTVGYTPDLAVGVWAGNADNRPMRDVSGVTGAAPLWRDIMTAALSGVPPRPFTLPPDIQRAPVCDPWGLRPGPWCPTVRDELFLTGTAPAQTETIYRQVEECAQPATPLERRPSADRRRRIVETLPQDVRERLAGVAPTVPSAPSAAQGQPPTPDGSPRVRLRLAGLAPGAVLILTRELPAESQRIETEALPDGPAPARVEVWDGAALLQRWDAPPYRFAWPPTPGVHRLRAVAYPASGT
ncbi:MAG: transglycosylase domain-containing protein, partial [Chloroflexi bacterium]|nr:transglycosylase domain-containing protein [Chloroflexota bacterium]